MEKEKIKSIELLALISSVAITPVSLVVEDQVDTTEDIKSPIVEASWTETADG